MAVYQVSNVRVTGRDLELLTLGRPSKSCGRGFVDIARIESQFPDRLNLARLRDSSLLKRSGATG